jgi:hypothetical protein
MSEKRVHGSARVQLTVEIPLSGGWGDDCTIGQLNKQAAEEAIGALRRGLVIDGMKNALVTSPVAARVIGTPVVIGILTEEDR